MAAPTATVQQRMKNPAVIIREAGLHHDYRWAA
jgi:hypothetical protein